MSTRRRCISAAALALVTIAMLVSAQLALAVFSKSATGGPLAVATSTLSPASAVSASQTNCRTNKSPEVAVEWKASGSSYASSYTLERATTSTGPYTSVASVAIGKTSYTDSSAALNYSTTYYYRVSTIYQSWSATSTSTSLKTLGKSCS